MRTLEGQGLNCKPKTTATHCAQAVDETKEDAQDGTPLVERNGLFDVYYSMLFLLRLAKIEPDEKSERRSQSAGSSGSGAPKRGQIVEAFYELFANRSDTQTSLDAINNYIDNTLQHLEKAEITALWYNLELIRSKLQDVEHYNSYWYSDTRILDSNKSLDIKINALSEQISNYSGGIRRAYFRIAPENYQISGNNAVLLSSNQTSAIFNSFFADICENFTIVSVGGNVKRNNISQFDSLDGKAFINIAAQSHTITLVIYDFTGLNTNSSTLLQAEFHIIIDYVAQ